MAAIDVDALLSAIDKCWVFHRRVRSTHPKLEKSMVGATEIGAPAFYRSQGYTQSITLDKPLTESDLQNLNDIAHWLNQSYIVRLYAILNSFRIVQGRSTIQKCLPNWKAVDVLVRLRNEFAHGSGRFKTHKGGHRKLLKDLLSVCGAEDDAPDPEEDWWLPITPVLDRLTKECREYASEMAARGGVHSSRSPRSALCRKLSPRRKNSGS